MKRNNSRLYAIQALYQRRIAKTPFEELKIQFHSDNIKRHSTDWEFFYSLINNIQKSEEEINRYIEKYAEDKISNINYVDFAILQLGVNELINFLETPSQIITKEYVGLAYDMGTENSYKFINAILDKLAKEVR